jgi:hypothetical protein
MNLGRSFFECRWPNLGKLSALLSTVTLFMGLAAGTDAQTIITNLLSIQSGTNLFALQFFSSRDPGQYSPDITQILIVNHGINYDADNYLAYGIDAAAHCPGASTNTLVIAPCLYITPFTNPPTNSTLYWLEQPSFGSQKAAYGYPQPTFVNFSPYSALDELSSNLLASTNFPNLNRMIWFGFSGGGQLINRYAACSTQNLQAAARKIHTRYVVGSPSSYLYFNPERPSTNSPGQYYVPSLETHTNYNDWGYGLTNLYSYPAVSGASVITNLYRQKFVVYCVGTLDDDPNDSSLDTSDAAELQGSQRLQRATNYFAYLRHFYGSNILQFQAFCLVSNIAHDAHGVLISNQGIKSVFDYEFQPVDSDGDGFSDWQEWLAGTDPKVFSDHPFLSGGKGGGGSISFSWQAHQSRRYRLLSAASLGLNWLTLTDTVATNVTVISNSVPATANSGFFRLQIDPQ